MPGAEVTLPDEVLDPIDDIVPPGTDIGHLDMACNPPAIQKAALRRRPADERTRRLASLYTTNAWRGIKQV